MKDLLEIQAEVERLAAVLGVSGSRSLPTYGRTEDFAHPHVEVDARGYHLVVVERGQELSRFTTMELDALLFEIFRGLTFGMGFAYELKHRIETQDCRRMGFRRQIELLEQLSPAWAAKQAAAHEAILLKHPFDDMSGVRATLTRELREAGHANEEAWRMACERYPLPGA